MIKLEQIISLFKKDPKSLQERERAELEKAEKEYYHLHNVVIPRERFQRRLEELSFPHDFPWYEKYHTFVENVGEIRLLVNSKETAEEAYSAITEGLRIIYNFDGGEFYLPKTGPIIFVEKFKYNKYRVALEALEELDKKYQLGEFKEDIKIYSKMIIKRMRKSCTEAKMLGEWLKEKGYLK